MASPFFRFQQFTVWHDQCAMKVGTDGVLLGAWCPLPARTHARVRVLDIGTGSGLIALMMAQRLHTYGDDYAICGIDIDANAAKQSRSNFEQSPWAEHLRCEACGLQEFRTEERFELIVSNPPYFQNSLKNPDDARATARHTESLSYRDLVSHAARLLTEDGILALVLPAEAEQEICSLAEENRLYATHITRVHSKPGKSAKRLLIALSPKQPANGCACMTTFYIEGENAPRSEEYQALTRDFYL